MKKLNQLEEGFPKKTSGKVKKRYIKSLNSNINKGRVKSYIKKMKT